MVPAWAMKALIAPTSPATAMVPPFNEIPVRSEAVPFDDDQPSVGTRPGRFGGVSLDADRSAHQILADSPPDKAKHGDIGPVPEPTYVIARIAVDDYLDVGW